MRVVLFLFAFLVMILGALTVMGAHTALQEIESLLLFLIAAVLLSAACVVDAIVHHSKQ